MSTKETRQYCAEQIRAVNRQKRTIDIIASDFSRDSYNSRIDQNGWDLDQFRRNPVILACHNDRQFVIAKALPETVRVEGQTLYMTVQFPDEGKHPDADIAFNLYADGFMRGVSVGFMPMDHEDVEEPDEAGNPISVRIYRRALLLEVSLVAIPSNDNALAIRSREKKADLNEVKRRTQELEAELAKREPVAQKLTLTVDVKNLEIIQKALENLKGDMEDAAAKYVQKCIGYFENKQPANKASTRVLAKFYKMRGTEPPANEVEAWRGIEDHLDEVVAVVKAEEVKEEKPTAPAETPAEKPAEPSTPAPAEPVVETPAEAPIVESEKPAEATPEETSAAPAEVKAEEPTQPSNPQPPVEEAPQPEQKSAEAPRRTVHISLAALQALPRVFGQVLANQAVEALRQGESVKELDGILDAAEQKLLSSLIPS